MDLHESGCSTKARNESHISDRLHNEGDVLCVSCSLHILNGPGQARVRLRPTAAPKPARPQRTRGTDHLTEPGRVQKAATLAIGNLRGARPTAEPGDGVELER